MLVAYVGMGWWLGPLCVRQPNTVMGWCAMGMGWWLGPLCETAQYRNGLVRYGCGLVAGPSVCETAQYRNGLVRWCGSSGGLNVGSRSAVRHLGRNGVLVMFEGRP